MTHLQALVCRTEETFLRVSKPVVRLLEYAQALYTILVCSMVQQESA
jgi:hypothetical protein